MGKEKMVLPFVSWNKRMIDRVYEETILNNEKQSSKVKYKLFQNLSILFYVVSVLWVIVGISIVPIGLSFIFLVVLPFAFILAWAIIFSKLRDKYMIDYDYQFLSGDVYVTKVINEKKRVKGVSFKCLELEKVGMYDSEGYKRSINNPSSKIIYMNANNSPSEGNDFYYVVYTRKENKNVVVLECSNRFISCITSFCNKNVIEEELKKQWFI